MLEQKIVLDSCLAIGECGLDKGLIFQWNCTICFEQQLLLAQKIQQARNYSLCSRFSRSNRNKKKLQIQFPIIIHGFLKHTAQETARRQWVLSFVW
jgi:Tat protein secretion system quality control protein TatD with DNase activity